MPSNQPLELTAVGLPSVCANVIVVPFILTPLAGVSSASAFHDFGGGGGGGAGGSGAGSGAGGAGAGAGAAWGAAGPDCLPPQAARAMSEIRRVCFMGLPFVVAARSARA